MCYETNTSARIILLAALAFGATLTAAQPSAFEVVSIRPTKSTLPGGVMDLRAGGQFSAENEVTLQLIRAAYNTDVYRIIGGPEWIGRERFDVQARTNASVTRDQTRVMLQTMLADRFKLRVRRESRELPIFELVPARSNGVTGPRLRPAAEGACVDRGPQPVGVRPGDLPSCGLLPAGFGRMSGRRVPMALLTTQLSSMMGRVVVDRTRLTGMFDIDLEWQPTEAQVASVAVLTPPGGTPPVFDPNRPGLTTAIDEQLGLKLQSATGPVEVVIVESIERPTAN
jgi:uncharacterized protein (TIGR03435 family)